MAGHAHAHEEAGQRNTRRLGATLVLALTYMAAEVVGGLFTGSLALLADAGHMFSDAGALGLSLVAVRIAHRPHSAQRTYGYHRAEILAALANAATLVAISIFIFVEAWRRLEAPHPVRGGPMLAVATGGLVVNLASLAILHGGREDNLNVRGVWLHVLADTLGSVQAMAAGALIWAFGWDWADPVASVLIGALVLYSSWGLLKAAVNVLMEGTPEDIDLDEVARALTRVPGVDGVHDLHVWTITSGFVALSAHVVAGPEAPPDLLVRLRTTLEEDFGIGHSTIQVEPRTTLHWIRRSEPRA